MCKKGKRIFSPRKWLANAADQWEFEENERPMCVSIRLIRNQTTCALLHVIHYIQTYVRRALEWQPASKSFLCWTKLINELIATVSIGTEMPSRHCWYVLHAHEMTPTFVFSFLARHPIFRQQPSSITRWTSVCGDWKIVFTRTIGMSLLMRWTSRSIRLAGRSASSRLVSAYFNICGIFPRPTRARLTSTKPNVNCWCLLPLH